jgi:hypothetical protein
VTDLSFEDFSKRLPSLADVQEAKRVVGKYLVIGIIKLPPELAVQLPNLARCLSVLETILAKGSA